MRDWDDYRLVLSIARAGSLSGAAAILGVRHSTVSRRLDAAEEVLGARLFERSRQGLVPTAAGERMAAAATRIESEHFDAERAVAGGDLRTEGTVRITAPDTVFDILVLPALIDLRRVHPGIRYESFLSNSAASLTRREADIAVRPTREPPETAVGRRIAMVSIAVYAAGTIDPEATDAPWIVPDESLDRYPPTAWAREIVPADRIVLRSNSVRAMADAARAGFGLAPLPCFLGDATPGLVRVGEPLRDLESPLWLLTHADLRDSARIRVVMDGLAAGLERVKDRLELH